MRTHWRKFINDTYLNESDFSHPETGEMITVIAKIVKIETEKVTNPSGKSDELPILYFEKPVKPLVLSAKVNFKNIESALKTAFVEDWIGQRIELFYDPNVKFGNQKVGGVRIRPRKPEKPKLTKTDKRVPKIKEKLSEGKTKIEDIQKFFEIESDLLTELKNVKNA